MNPRPACPPRPALICLAISLAVVAPALAAQAAQRNQAAQRDQSAQRKHAAPKKPDQVIGCTGPFAKSVTHASLVKAFGANNVAVRSVGIGEGETVKASVIFPRGAARRVEVLWIDEKRLRNPSEIRTGVESQWRREHGIRRGMSLHEIESLNGRPFRLYGFGFDYGGTTLDWNGGTLATQAGGCTLQLRFTMRDGADNAAIYGEERSFTSDDAGMRKAAPVVDAVALGFEE